MKTAPCPNCGGRADLSKSNEFRPFCSRRCKLIDLGEWLDEQNRIPEKDSSQPWQNNSLQ